jgi:malate dehydrogenase (oxaloacetate-decarboxylating)(NADP+)
MIYASAESLSTSLNEQEVADGWLYPDIRRIREVSVIVARGVIRAAQQNGVDRATELRDLNDEELDAFIMKSMYNPHGEREYFDDKVAQLVAGTNGTANGHTNGISDITNSVAHL